MSAGVVIGMIPLVFAWLDSEEFKVFTGAVGGFSTDRRANDENNARLVLRVWNTCRGLSVEPRSLALPRSDIPTTSQRPAYASHVSLVYGTALQHELDDPTALPSRELRTRFHK